MSTHKYSSPWPEPRGRPTSGNWSHCSIRPRLAPMRGAHPTPFMGHLRRHRCRPAARITELAGNALPYARLRHVSDTLIADSQEIDASVVVGELPERERSNRQAFELCHDLIIHHSNRTATVARSPLIPRAEVSKAKCLIRTRTSPTAFPQRSTPCLVGCICRRVPMLSIMSSGLRTTGVRSASLAERRRCPLNLSTHVHDNFPKC